MTDSIDISVLIPCLNEQDNVQGALETVCTALKSIHLKFEVLVIDDGSKDATYARACEFRDKHPEYTIQVHKNGRNLGLATSFVNGAAMTHGKYYRICCGDNVEPVETLLQIFGQAGKADILAPYQPDVVGRAWHRKLLSRTYTFLINTLSGHRLKYYNGCALLLRKDVLRWQPYSKGFGFQADMLTRMLDAGATIIQFPVKAVDRQSGSSTALTRKNFISTGAVMFKIVYRRLRRLGSTVRSARASHSDTD